MQLLNSIPIRRRHINITSYFYVIHDATTYMQLKNNKNDGKSISNKTKEMHLHLLPQVTQTLLYYYILMHTSGIIVFYSRFHCTQPFLKEAKK